MRSTRLNIGQRSLCGDRVFSEGINASVPNVGSSLVGKRALIMLSKRWAGAALLGSAITRR